MSTSTDKNFIVASLGYRIQTYHKGLSVQIGAGNTDADILVVQPHMKMPDRDAVTGALKNFGMLSDAYRASSIVVDDDSQLRLDINRSYLRELIQIIDPLVVVTCGIDTTSLLKDKRIRSFSGHTGKKFEVDDISGVIFYATINPTEYGFARAPVELKDQGRQEWMKLASIYKKLKENKERLRWE
jgi:hypothetical protein